MIQQIPEEVKKLIIRKLRHKRCEQERLWVSISQKAYAKMNEEILKNIGSGALGQAFTSIPLAAYSEIATGTIAVTKKWPGIVWEITASLLDKAHVVSPDDQELNAIVNEFAWAIEQKPFTLDYIDPAPFKGCVDREARRYGIDQADITAPFNRQMDAAAKLAECAILNTSRTAREGVGIAIEEFLRAQKAHSGPESKKAANKDTGQPQNDGLMTGLEIGSPEWRTQNAQNAANVRHNQPGGSREKQQQIRDIWASGKYSSREICAEQECAALNISFATARKALRNTPDPT